MEDFVEAFLNVEILQQAWRILLKGLLNTVLLSCIAVPVGLAAGLALAFMSRGHRWLRWSAAAFVDLFRSVPPLVLLVLLYAGLPFAGIDLGAWGAVALCFLLNSGAYYCEVLRAGLEAIPQGQSDAARALGLRPHHAMRLVVLPQAVRIVMPDLLSNTIEVVKLTSIASVVALPELLFTARQAQSATYNATPILGAALGYFLLLWPVVRILSRLEEAKLAGRR